ncbi:MAG: PQQ-binding-like beta-propeller repeat protein, partial [Phycisphaerales bacterium]|nr:PQQ-binding-like beta-propeller repeat protein [Phycisphaerales bacterium]
RVHRALLSNAPLLARYREVEEPIARRALEQGEAHAVERSRLLTTSGLNAALDVARRRLEHAQFWAAWHTLEPLRLHPDAALGAPGARQAVELAIETARYLNDPWAWERLNEWADARGLRPEAAAAVKQAVRPPEIQRGVSPFDASPRVELAGILARPLSSESLRPEESPSSTTDTGVQPGPTQSQNERFVLPTVAGDTIFVNTGRDLFAWDRFTLTPRWPRQQFKGFASPERGGAANIEDTATVTVWGPWAVATSGLARVASREGDERVHAVDVETGETVWSTDIRRFDAALSDAYIRGPAIIDEQMVIVGAVRVQASRRLTSAYLVGIDLGSGEVLWSRMLASAGAAPYGRSQGPADAGVAHRGVTLRTDRIGVISAVESATGRLRWARRVPPETVSTQPNDPWETPRPVIDGERLFTLTADRREVLSLDVQSGAVLARASARDMGAPHYLLGAPGAILAVGSRSVYALPKSLDVENERVARLLPPDGPELRGRVVVAGDVIFAPIAGGVATVPIAGGGDGYSVVPLDRPGNVLALPDELVVVDDASIHTYLLWEVAERMLAERMRDNPNDPIPAVTYAELAHRAGKPERIIDAADRAIGAIRLDPASPRNDSARRRLFRSSLAMLDPAAPSGAPLGETVVQGLIERLGALASTPEERVAHLFAAGDHAEAVDDGPRAVARYQAVLEDDALAAAIFSRRGVATAAEIEATRRLRRVVREHGPAVYTVFEAEAERGLTQAAERADVEALEGIGRRWPVSAAASRAWLLASDLLTHSGEPDRALRALESGLLAADDALLADPSVVGELGGRFVLALERAGQTRAAAQALRRLAIERPTLALTDRGATIDAFSLADRLDRAVAALDRRPSVGTLAADHPPQTLDGWTIVQPIVGAGVSPPADFAVMVSQGGYIGVFSPASIGVKERWRMNLASGAKLVRTDARSLFLSVETDAGATGGRTVTRYDVEAGPDAPLWSTPPFRSLFANAEPDPRLRVASEGRLVTIRTPMSGVVRITDLLIVFDHRSFALIERSGRAAGFDLETGRALWTLERTLFTVNDAAGDGGVLTLVGTDPPAPGLDVLENDGRPAFISLDMRTGRTLHKAQSDLGQARWIRATPQGRAILGLDGGVVCIDALQSEERWRLTAPAGRASINAWRFPGRVIVMDPEGSLWHVEEDDGAVRDAPLDARGRVRRGERIVAQPIGDNALFLSSSGALLVGRDGEVVGRDVRPGAAGVAMPILTADAIIAIDADADASSGVFNVRSFTTASAATVAIGAVALAADPFELAAVDGRLLVSAGDVTVVYHAPAP